MAKIPSQSAFYNVNKALLLELGPFNIITLSYIAEWCVKGSMCFASRKTISAETGFSEKTVQNSIKELIRTGYVKVSHSGRKRSLTLTNKASTAYPLRGYKIPLEGVGDTQVRGYEILTTNKDITNKDITNINLLKDKTLDINYNNTKEEKPMTKEEHEERERLLRLAKLSSEGWQDKGTYLEKWDEATRTMIRQNKLVHNPQRWNHDS